MAGEEPVVGVDVQFAADQSESETSAPQIDVRHPVKQTEWAVRQRLGLPQSQIGEGRPEGHR